MSHLFFDFFHENENDTNSKDALLELALDLLSLAKQGKYTKMLLPPNGSVVHRFISLPAKQASKILGISVDEINSNTNKITTIENCPSYKPHKNILSSWILDPNLISIAHLKKYFTNINNNNVHILLSALTDENNFLLNPLFLKKIDKHFENEMETIGVGPIKIWKAVYLSTKKNNLFEDTSPPASVKISNELHNIIRPYIHRGQPTEKIKSLRLQFVSPPSLPEKYNVTGIWDVISARLRKGKINQYELFLRRVDDPSSTIKFLTFTDSGKIQKVNVL